MKRNLLLQLHDTTFVQCLYTLHSHHRSLQSIKNALKHRFSVEIELVLFSIEHFLLYSLPSVLPRKLYRTHLDYMQFIPLLNISIKDTYLHKKVKYDGYRTTH